MLKNKFQGLGVAMVTPFNADGKVDFVGLEKLTQHLINGGVNYLVVQGTTGENVTLSKEEKKEVCDFIISVNKGRLPIVLGVGGSNTAEILEQLKTYDFKGVDAILSVSPYYSKPTQEGIYQHFKIIADTSPVPVILYNVPGRTGSNMTVETILRIANASRNVIAVKEASGNMDQMMQIIQNKPAGFELISGDDAITLPIMAAGAIGVISVVGNALPKRFSTMVSQCLNQEFFEAQKLHYQLYDIIGALFEEGNPGGVKEILQMLNICKNNLRMPLVPVSENHKQKLYKLLADKGILNN